MSEKKKIKLTIFLLFLGICLNYLNSEKLFEFSDIYNPLQIAVDNNYFYVSDGFSVNLYSLKNFELIRKFGKKGSGPGEFSRNLIYFQILPENNEILLYSPLNFSIVLFNLEGDIIKEHKTIKFIRKIYKVSDNYILNDMGISKNGSKIKYTVNNSSFNELAEIETKKPFVKFSKKKNIEIIYPIAIEGFKCTSKNIFITSSREDLFFEIYDHMGKKIRTIKNEYDNIKISSKEKMKLRMDYFNQLTMLKIRKSFVKKIKMTVPDIYPAIQDFIIADQKIYVKTYLRKNGKQEFIILNYNGVILKKAYLPIIRNEIYQIGPKLYTIKNNKYYYLKENEDSEDWELYSKKIL